MDVGSSPNKKFSDEYQAGALSFEFVSNGKKIFTNSGYYDEGNTKFKEISKSSAMHNVLIVDDNSSCKFIKNSISKNTNYTIPTAIIIGSEEDGISAEILKMCNAKAKIPINGEISSLNVSVATGIMLYEIIRQRNSS